MLCAQYDGAVLQISAKEKLCNLKINRAQGTLQTYSFVSGEDRSHLLACICSLSVIYEL